MADQQKARLEYLHVMNCERPHEMTGAEVEELEYLYRLEDQSPVTTPYAVFHRDEKGIK